MKTVKRMAFTALCCGAIIGSLAIAQSTPAPRQGVEKGLIPRVDSLESSLRQTDKSLERLCKSVDSLAIIKSQREILLDDAHRVFERTLSLLEIVIAGAAILAVIIGYFAKRAIDRFEAKLKQIETAENKLADQRAEFERIIAEGKSEVLKTIQARQDAEQKVAQLGERIKLPPITEAPSEEMRKELDELAKKLRDFERLGGELSAEAHYQRGVDQYYKNLFDSALLSFERAIELQPDYAEAWAGKGGVLQMLERYQEALVACDKAIELKLNLSDAWNNKAVALEGLQQYGEALKASEKAIELEPNLAEAWYNKGAILGKLGRWEESVKASDKAIELKPKYKKACYNRARAYSRLGKKTEALSDLKKAIELDESFKEKAQKDEDFRNLWDDDDFKKLVE